MRPAAGLVCILPFLVLGAQEPGKLTVDSLFHPSRRVAYLEPAPSRFFWRPDGTLVEERLKNSEVSLLARMDLATWAAKPILTSAQLAAALEAAGADPKEAASACRNPFTWNPARDAFLVPAGQELYLLELPKGEARLLTEAPGLKEAPVFSPDGTRVAYLRGNDLYVADGATGKETRLTTGGDEEHFNGRLDWLYQEEIFGRDQTTAFWWSPDSKRVAFLSLDETPVPIFTLLDDRIQPQRKITTHYPQAGEPNPVARVGIAELDGTITWVPDPFPGQDTLVVQVGWDPQNRLVANYQDRIQSWLDCRRFEDGKSLSLIREESRTWVEHLPLPRFLLDGGFLWTSARSGYHHLYRYDAQGQLVGPVTDGPWDVRKLHGVDEKTGRVFFDGTLGNAIGLDAFRADLEPGAPNRNLRRITTEPGTHILSFNPAFTAALDTWSDINTPIQTAYLNTEGQVLHRFPSKTSPAFQAARPGKVSFQTVPTRDGGVMETMLVLPPDFNPGRKYPVFQYVYGGPGAPLVRNTYNRSDLWFQFLAQQGIVTWICDNRSASAKGVASAQAVYRSLGPQELQDQLDGLAWLKSRGWADMDRVALYGYSFGGYLAAYALTHSKAWKLGILGAPVVDWRLYDSVYTEHLMGLPKDNPKGYDDASALLAAGSLHGKVMLIHGTLDGNVHLQNSIRFLDALEKTEQLAPLTLLPGAGHSPRAPQHTWAMHEAIWEFLRANL